MNINSRLWYYFTVIAFPLFFVLHGVNEQFGLIRNGVIAWLFIYYLLVAVGVALVSKLIMKTDDRATVYTFFLLCIFFFFGAVKDLISKTPLNEYIGSYKILLVIIALLLIFKTLAIAKYKSKFTRASLFIRTFLVICLLIETGLLIYNVVSHKSRQKDLGDIDHTLIKNITPPASASKPFIFWIVMDEYAGGTALQKRWNFENPLDTMLRARGFFVADSANSPYNYTHYSLASTLDMTYLKGLRNHSVIGYRDIVRGNTSLNETNTVKLLESNDYNISNYTIYNIADHPTYANEYFINADFKLINNQTLEGRINQDIGWNFKNMFSADRRKADSTDHSRNLEAEARYRRSLMNECLEAARKASDDEMPTFFMFHFMETHEPFIYNADGTLDLTVGYDVYPEKYIPSINHANKALSGLIDSIQHMYRNRDIVIILQGDHGYKFDENDPLFDKEGCSILYAVYCSDGSYPGWTNTFNSVNGFRVLFNKYFRTSLPILENHSYNLYYR